ncbi:response regulator [Thiohalobacter thiocyanaticus]|uniref:DNA-binding response regulator n=1 Tax=Thiohalobacter thiocyanaticus TaxID=585455 RepID=A0A426QMA3_9GAMM|nr:response regulator transcription factor [Thiohalobacter thiocyanaticus]RRQ22891.1 DNA-binding response regulator [Thiohalobacter thiocyanaticus]
MINVIVADDHPVVRSGIVRVLDADAEIRTIGEAESGTRAIELVKALDCDVLVLDISMPGRGIVETIQRTKACKAHVGILIFSMHPPEQYALRLLRTGASGYLAKDSPVESLTIAVHTIFSGKRYIPEEFAECMAENLTSHGCTPVHHSLNDREFEIFRRLSRGKDIKEISDEMYLSSKTVSAYRRRILSKMGMSGNSDLMQYSLSNNLIE